MVNRVHEHGHQVTGIRRGWGGLLSTDLDDPDSRAANLVELDPVAVRTVDRTGGTFLHSSRTNPGRVRTGDVPDFLAGSVSGEGPHDLTDAHDVRVRGDRELAVQAGLTLVDQTKLITAASELARNTLVYGGGGRVVAGLIKDTTRTGVHAE